MKELKLNKLLSYETNLFDRLDGGLETNFLLR